MPGDTPDWVTQEAPVGRLSTEPIGLTAREAGETVDLVVPGAGEAIILTELAVDPQPAVGFALSLRDWVTVILTDVPPTAAFGQATISPSSPSALVSIPPGSAALPLGSTLRATAYSRPGSGKQTVILTVKYYLV